MAQLNFAFKARFNCACQVVGFAIGLAEPIHDLQGLLLPIGLRLNDALYPEQDVEQVREEVVDLIRIDVVLQAEDFYLQDRSPGRTHFIPLAHLSEVCAAINCVARVSEIFFTKIHPIVLPMAHPTVRNFVRHVPHVIHGFFCK